VAQPYGPPRPVNRDTSFIIFVMYPFVGDVWCVAESEAGVHQVP
jgi:hypothetical protein